MAVNNKGRENPKGTRRFHQRGQPIN